MAVNLGCNLYLLAIFVGTTSVPVRRSVLPVREVLLEPGVDLVGRSAVLQPVVVAVRLTSVRVLLGREDLGVAVEDELDDDARIRAVVVYAGAEATASGEVCSAVVERGLVEHRGALASLVVHEVGPHAVARRDLLPACGERHVGEHLVTGNLAAEDHPGLLEHPAVVLAHVGREGVTGGEGALTVGLLSPDGITRTLGALGAVHGDLDETVEVRGVARCSRHYYAFSASLAWVPLA